MMLTIVLLASHCFKDSLNFSRLDVYIFLIAMEVYEFICCRVENEETVFVLCA